MKKNNAVPSERNPAMKKVDQRQKKGVVIVESQVRNTNNSLCSNFRVSYWTTQNSNLIRFLSICLRPEHEKFTVVSFMISIKSWM